MSAFGGKADIAHALEKHEYDPVSFFTRLSELM